MLKLILSLFFLPNLLGLFPTSWAGFSPSQGQNIQSEVVNTSIEKAKLSLFSQGFSNRLIEIGGLSNDQKYRFLHFLNSAGSLADLKNFIANDPTLTPEQKRALNNFINNYGASSSSSNNAGGATSRDSNQNQSHHKTTESSNTGEENSKSSSKTGSTNQTGRNNTSWHQKTETTRHGGESKESPNPTNNEDDHKNKTTWSSTRTGSTSHTGESGGSRFSSGGGHETRSTSHTGESGGSRSSSANTPSASQGESATSRRTGFFSNIFKKIINGFQNIGKKDSERPQPISSSHSTPSSEIRINPTSESRHISSFTGERSEQGRGSSFFSAQRKDDYRKDTNRPIFTKELSTPLPDKKIAASDGYQRGESWRSSHQEGEKGSGDFSRDHTSPVYKEQIVPLQKIDTSKNIQVLPDVAISRAAENASGPTPSSSLGTEVNTSVAGAISSTAASVATTAATPTVTETATTSAESMGSAIATSIATDIAVHTFSAPPTQIATTVAVSVASSLPSQMATIDLGGLGGGTGAVPAS